MATNPMQRKANNYLLMGILGTLVITGAIIAFLFMKLTTITTEMKNQEAGMKKIYVASKDIASGETVSLNNLKQVSVPSGAVPSDTINPGELDENSTAKIDLKIGTAVTSNMVNMDGEETPNDLRIQEYNMVILPTELENDNYIDIRLRLPNGTDYIVVSKKKVEIPEIASVGSASTIKVKVTEEEILMMSNAIVEAYWLPGSLLYATTYTEPGIQEASTATYLPSEKVVELMNTDPNIVAVAKNELFTRYNTNASSTRGNIVNSLLAVEDGSENVKTGVEEEITKAKEERQSYLEALGGY